jgi:oligopeptidase B
VPLADDYAWLRDKQNPEVTAYLEAENAYADAVLAPLNGLREQLYQEMLSHMKQTDISVPYRDGAWWYYSRTEEGSQYAIYCRKHAAVEQTPGAPGPDSGTWESSPEQVILDGNELA